MRIRKKKHGAERIEACSHLLITPDEAFKANIEQRGLKIAYVDKDLI